MRNVPVSQPTADKSFERTVLKKNKNAADMDWQTYLEGTPLNSDMKSPAWKQITRTHISSGYNSAVACSCRIALKVKLDRLLKDSKEKASKVWWKSDELELYGLLRGMTGPLYHDADGEEVSMFS